MHELRHEFTSRKVSPWGGVKFFHQAYQESGIRDTIQSIDFPWPESNRGYDAVDKIEQFMTSVVLGSRRLSHGDYLRADEVVREIFGWKKGIASASAMSRFFSKFTTIKNQRQFPTLMQGWWKRQPIERVTLDVDSTVIQRYGNGKMIEGATKGYNARRPGRLSHHPIISFCAELNMVVNAWMRPGCTGDAFEASEFIEESIECLGSRQRVGLVRADAGFYSDRLMSMLEDVNIEKPERQPINYIIRAKLFAPLADAISKLTDGKFQASDRVWKGAEYAQVMYQAQGWKTARRIVVVRTPRSLSSGAGSSRQPKLFASDERLSRYHYRVMVTNTTLSGQEVHKLYNGRADCENRIKELKHDYGADGFAFKSMAATEAAFMFVMLAYNIMALLKQYVLKSRHHLPTIRFQCIAIGSYLVKSGRTKKLKLSAEGKRRHFLEHIFDNTSQIGLELVS